MFIAATDADTATAAAAAISASSTSDYMVVVEMPYTCFSCSALFGFINYYFVDKYIMGDATRFFSLNRLLFSDFHILKTHTETIGFFFCSSLALQSRIIYIYTEIVCSCTPFHKHHRVLYGPIACNRPVEKRDK